ncbi:DUF2218 domain-containing protein [Gymnodinialimonas sp. 2305UL16-5]|uniref:DUF2218 domain-containing protein n=1 Tax=Gymnodinialimonas mytili TaxID=3126503 RepID=UPI0030B6CDB6
MLTQIGTFPTRNAGRYIQQLCKHFAHKVAVEVSGAKGLATLPPGPAEMRATEDHLVVSVSGADSEGLEASRHIIDSHLKRFAFREGFEAMDWQTATSDAAE